MSDQTVNIDNFVNQLLQDGAPVLSLDPTTIRYGYRARTDNGDIEAFAREIVCDGGQMMPILVYQHSKHGPVLIDGMRRTLACEHLGCSVKALVCKPNDKLHLLDLQLAANLNRKNFDLIELALGLAKRKKIYEKANPETVHGATGRGRTKEGKAERFVSAASKQYGLNEAKIYELLAIANLPQERLDELHAIEGERERNAAARNMLSSERKERKKAKLQQEAAEKAEQRKKEREERAKKAAEASPASKTQEEEEEVDLSDLDDGDESDVLGLLDGLDDEKEEEVDLSDLDAVADEQKDESTPQKDADLESFSTQPGTQARVLYLCSSWEEGIPSHVSKGGIDLILTDPQYSLDWNIIKHTERTDLSEPVSWDQLDTRWVLELAPYLDEGGQLIAFCPSEAVGEYRARCIQAGLNYRCCIHWHKSNPAPQHRPGYGSSVECIIWAVKGDRPYFKPWENAGSKSSHNFKEGPICAGKERLDHPTQKPEWIIEELLTRHSSEGFMVVDPFAGVGTVPAVCKRLGRLCVATEIDPKYHEQGAARLELIG